jgi:hypothetical protein
MVERVCFFVARLLALLVLALPLEAQQGIALAGYSNCQTTGWPVTNGTSCVDSGTGRNGTFTILHITAGDTTIPFATFIDGSSAYGTEVGEMRSLYVDPVSGDIFVGGRAGPGVATTSGVFQTSFAGSSGDNAVLSRYSASGTLRWRTYIGVGSNSGEQTVYSICGLDSSGNVIVAGQFLPVSTIDGVAVTKIGNAGAGTTNTSYVASISGDGSTLNWFTELGGSEAGGMRGRCTMDSTGIYGMSGDRSVDYPTTPGVYQPAARCTSTAPQWCNPEIWKMNLNGSALLYATYVGGTVQGSSTAATTDCETGLALDPLNPGNLFVTCYTSDNTFFNTSISGAYRSTFTDSDGVEIAILELNSTASALVAGTFLGGTVGGCTNGICQIPSGITFDGNGNVIIYGSTSDSDFPTTPGAYMPTKPYSGTGSINVRNGFVSKLNHSLAALLASTYIGGNTDNGAGCCGDFVGSEDGSIWADSAGNVWMHFDTASTNWPTTSNAYSTSFIGAAPGPEAALVALNSSLSALIYGSYIGFGQVGQGSFVSLSVSGGAPVASVSPSKLSFSAALVGTTSPAQTVTLQNSGNAAMNVSISISGDFGETNNCGSSLAPSATCTLSVTFDPSAAGTRTGAVTISDNAVGSPQTVSLTGIGEDFIFTVLPGSSTSATVSPGGTATYQMSVAGQGGLNQTISFACSGAPSEATCTVSPATVTPSGSTATTVTVSVSTTAPSMAPPVSGWKWRRWPVGITGLVVLLALTMLVVMWWVIGSRGRVSTLPRLALGTVMLLGALGTGCGGASAVHNPGTPAGTYNLTLTATATSGSTTLQHSVSLELTVQ